MRKSAPNEHEISFLRDLTPPFSPLPGTFNLMQRDGAAFLKNSLIPMPCRCLDYEEAVPSVGMTRLMIQEGNIRTHHFNLRRKKEGVFRNPAVLKAFSRIEHFGFDNSQRLFTPQPLTSVIISITNERRRRSEKKIEELERENRALRSAVAGTAKRNVIVVSEGSYQGHPTITFEVSGRPFTLGLRKASVVLYCSELVQSFVKRHKGEIEDWEIVEGSSEVGEAQAKAEVKI